MAEVFARFAAPVPDGRGDAYTAKVCGREREDGLWEGWIEFEHAETGDTVRTERETTQPNPQDMAYWASGLSAIYLEGALDRTLTPARPEPAHMRVDGPVFDRPFERPDA